MLSQVAKWWTAAVSVKYVLYESLADVGYGNTGCEEFRRGVQKCKVNSFKGYFFKWNGSMLNGHAYFVK